jgi:hypothetical protein
MAKSAKLMESCTLNGVGAVLNLSNKLVIDSRRLGKDSTGSCSKSCKICIVILNFAIPFFSEFEQRKVWEGIRKKQR